MVRCGWVILLLVQMYMYSIKFDYNTMSELLLQHISFHNYYENKGYSPLNIGALFSENAFKASSLSLVGITYTYYIILT